MYNSLSPVMQITTGGSMLNFGYWNENTKNPLVAQQNLCNYIGKLSELENAQKMIDLGSGLSAPAIFWRDQYTNLEIYCININFNQLRYSGLEKNIEFINSTSTNLPFKNNSVDRIISLESSQHFKPFENFVSESSRVLNKSGLFVLALPVVLAKSSLRNLGILKWTWSSEHHSIDSVKQIIISKGFNIIEQKLIGKEVYDPLAIYYLKNRNQLRKLIKQKYPDFVEKILYQSILKMKSASENKIIDYIILKCKFQN